MAECVPRETATPQTLLIVAWLQVQVLAAVSRSWRATLLAHQPTLRQTAFRINPHAPRRQSATSASTQRGGTAVPTPRQYLLQGYRVGIHGQGHGVAAAQAAPAPAAGLVPLGALLGCSVRAAWCVGAWHDAARCDAVGARVMC